MPITLGNTNITGLGVGGLPSGVVNATTLANSAVVRDKIGYAGAILQVQQFTKRDYYTASGGYGDPGLDVVITPFYASSKILVMLHIVMNTNATTVGGKLRRNGAQISIANASGSADRTTWIDNVPNNAWMQCSSIMFLDSPNSTSALTYDVIVRSHDGRIYRVNHNDSLGNTGNLDQGGATSSITVMEISN